MMLSLEQSPFLTFRVRNWPSNRKWHYTKDNKKADIVAMTVAELMKRRLAPWDALKECLTSSLERLPDMKSHGCSGCAVLPLLLYSPKKGWMRHIATSWSIVCSHAC